MPCLGNIQGCEASNLDHDSKSSIIGGVKPLPPTQMILPDADFVFCLRNYLFDCM